jgi:hypothetical protein
MVLAASGATLAVAAAPAGASNTEMTAAGSFTTFFMMHALFPEVNNINPNPETGSETQSIAADSLTCSGGVTYSTSLQPPNGSGQGKTALAAEEADGPTLTNGCIDFSRSSSPPAPHSETLPSTQTESGDPSGSHLDYYAYALDGVAPLVGSDAPTTVSTPGANTGAGLGLTLAQVQAIYKCVDTNWDQITVGTGPGSTGANEPIVLFWPQSGSGTRAVYTDVLGFDPTNPSSVTGDLCTTSGTTITAPIVGFTQSGVTTPNEENTEDGIIYQNSIGDANTTPATPADTTMGPTHPAPPNSVAAEAIYIYSAGKFSAEWNDSTDNNSTADNVVDQALTGSTNTLGNFDANDLNMASMRSTGMTPTGEAYVDLTTQNGSFNEDTNRGLLAVDGNTVSEANEWYSHLPNPDNTANPSISTASVPGVRYVYNVADTLLPGYNGAKDLIGFDNQSSGSRSVLCNGDDASTITAQGFLPLTTGSGSPTGSDADGATCREFQGLTYPGQAGALHWFTPTFDSRSH